MDRLLEVSMSSSSSNNNNSMDKVKDSSDSSLLLVVVGILGMGLLKLKATAKVLDNPEGLHPAMGSHRYYLMHHTCRQIEYNAILLYFVSFH